MSFVIASVVTIRLLGLGTFTDEVPTQPGVVHYIMPAERGAYWVDSEAAQLEHSHARITAPAAHAKSLTSGKRCVEKHVSYLIFDASVTPTGTWASAVKTLGQPSLGLKYVELGGHRGLKFETPGITNAPASIAGLQLPRVGTTCPEAKHAGLRPEFKPPFTGASAVLQIPQATQLKACRAIAQREKLPRLDTELQLNASGNLVLTSGTTGKQLTFAAGQDLQFVIVNVPPRYFSGSTNPKNATEVDGEPHFLSYYRMAAIDPNLCTSSLDSTPLTVAGDCTVKLLSNQIAAIGRRGRGAGANAVQDATFECSNTIYP